MQGVLLAQGFEVLDCDIVPTPTVQYLVIAEQACGGIIVTSSHNPVDWNGLKFVDQSGLFLAPEYWKDISAFASNPSLVTWPLYNELGTLTPFPEAINVRFLL